jgi:hypothetical protein
MLAFSLAILAAITSIIATCASAWQAYLLRRQLRQDDQIREASIYQAIAGYFMQLDLLFIERPHLRPYFYENVEPTDLEASQQASALAEYIVDMAESCMATDHIAHQLSGDWDEYFGHLYKNSPALRNYWADFGHFFPAGLQRSFTGPPRRPKQRPSPTPAASME